VVDQLADEYADAGKPVVFIEQDVDTPVDSSRKSRWWAAHGSGTVTLPLVMVDSGNQISNGYEDFYTKYKSMVDTALARSPKASITATSQRVDNHFHFEIQATNLSGVTLSSSNSARVYAIVYEDDAADGLTERYVRTTASTGISSLADGATESFTLDTPDLSGVENWDNIHSLVLVDYRPGGYSGAYDMLQAALEEAESPQSGLKVFKSAEPDQVQAGDTLTYTIRVSNASDADLHTAITDYLPPQVTYGGATIWTPTITQSGGVWTTTFAVIVNAGFTGTLVNKVVVTSTEGLSATGYALTNAKKIYLPIILRGL